MAYPNYSIVVVETTVDGVTESETKIYESVLEANSAYQSALKAGNRAFLYEKPVATKHSRNDLQPFPST
jgi:hypothetical protein